MITYKIQCCFFFVQSLENHKFYTHKILYNFSYAVQCNFQEESGKVGQGHLTGSCPSCTGGGRGGNIGVDVRQIIDHSNHFTLLFNPHKINKFFFNAFLCQVNTCQLPCYHFYHIFLLSCESLKKNEKFFVLYWTHKCLANQKRCNNQNWIIHLHVYQVYDNNYVKFISVIRDLDNQKRKVIHHSNSITLLFFCFFKIFSR